MSGFVALPGTDWSIGDTKIIAERLDTLGKRLDETIYGISGYRTPSHSVAVGGSANDPHTKAQAGDVGVGAPTRASAAGLSDAQLASVGLYRPFKTPAEVNHVQLLPAGQQAMNAAKTSPTSAIVDGLIGGPVGAAAGLKNEANAATGLAGATGLPGKAEQAAQNALTDWLAGLWQQITAKAQYAGLFVLLLAAGATLIVTGIVRAAGRRQPQETPS